MIDCDPRMITNIEDFQTELIVGDDEHTESDIRSEPFHGLITVRLASKLRGVILND